MKKVLIVILFVLLICGGGFTTYYFIHKKSAEKEKEKIVYTDGKLDQNIVIDEDLNVEFGRIKHLKDFITINNTDFKDVEIKYEDLGTTKVEFSYEIDGIKYYRYLDFNVVDTTAPLATVPSVKSILIGTEINFINDFWCGDNHDKIPDKNLEGYFDLSKLGSYNVVFVAKDSSGNETRKPFTLRVVDELPKSNSSNQSGPINYLDFNYLYSTYKNDNTKIGIDVSRWQGDIDFKKLSQTNVEFIMIRLGGQDGIDGEYYIDSKFTQNIENALKYGYDVGVYFYSYAYTKDEAIKQAKYVIKNLKDYKITLPIVFDWECWNKFNKFDSSFYDITKVQDTFLNYVESKGYKGSRYGSKNYLTNVWQDSKHLTWLAHYISNTTYEGDYYMWQRCDTGKVDGINGAVDVDILYLDKYKI